MFYYHEVLVKKKGPLCLLWLAGTLKKPAQFTEAFSLRKVLKVDVVKAVDEIDRSVQYVFPNDYIVDALGDRPPRFSLYLSSVLLYGVCRILCRQVSILCNELRSACKKAADRESCEESTFLIPAPTKELERSDEDWVPEDKQWAGLPSSHEEIIKWYDQELDDYDGAPLDFSQNSVPSSQITMQEDPIFRTLEGDLGFGPDEDIELAQRFFEGGMKALEELPEVVQGDLPSTLTQIEDVPQPMEVPQPVDVPQPMEDLPQPMEDVPQPRDVPQPMEDVPQPGDVPQPMEVPEVIVQPPPVVDGEAEINDILDLLPVAPHVRRRRRRIVIDEVTKLSGSQMKMQTDNIFIETIDMDPIPLSCHMVFPARLFGRPGNHISRNLNYLMTRNFNTIPQQNDPNISKQNMLNVVDRVADISLLAPSVGEGQQLAESMQQDPSEILPKEARSVEEHPATEVVPPATEVVPPAIVPLQDSGVQPTVSESGKRQGEEQEDGELPPKQKRKPRGKSLGAPAVDLPVDGTVPIQPDGAHVPCPGVPIVPEPPVVPVAPASGTMLEEHPHEQMGFDEPAQIPEFPEGQELLEQAQQPFEPTSCPDTPLSQRWVDNEVQDRVLQFLTQTPHPINILDILPAHQTSRRQASRTFSVLLAMHMNDTINMHQNRVDDQPGPVLISTAQHSDSLL